MITEFTQIVDPVHEGLNPELNSIIKAISRETKALMLKHSIGQGVVDYATGEYDTKKAMREAAKLDILVKKRQLGIPYTDDDLEGYRRKSLLDKAKTPAVAVLIQQTSPSVFAGLPQAVPQMMPMPVAAPMPVASPFPAPFSMGPPLGIGLIDLGKKAGNFLKTDIKKGLISSIIKSLK